MDENSLRSALGAIASDPEPPATIDIAAARRSGRRRHRAVRIAASAAVALAVALAVAIPYGLPAAVPVKRGVLATPARPGHLSSAVVLFADFGWLPPGFKEAPALFSGEVTPNALSRDAQGPNGMLNLLVRTRGQCGAPGTKKAASCYGPGPFTALAPLNGRPAWGEQPRVSSAQSPIWAQSLIWEYSPGAFARVVAYVVHKPQFSTAQLREVAGRVKFASQLMTFPFQLNGVPASWRISDAQGWASPGNAHICEASEASVYLGPPSDRSAVQVTLWQPAAAASQRPQCGQRAPGSAKRVTSDGVDWYYYSVSGAGQIHTQTIVSRVPSAATAGFGISITVHVPSSYGDPFDVFHRMTLLGTNPANWTTRPLG
jgi:hypothetical protein